MANDMYFALFVFSCRRWQASMIHSVPQNTEVSSCFHGSDRSKMKNISKVGAACDLDGSEYVRMYFVLIVKASFDEI